MDSLSQMVLGAATAEAVAGKKLGNKAILWGAIGGTIPDLDVLFYFKDPLTQLTFHRGPSHSLLFAVVVAPLLGWLLWKVYRRSEATWRDWTLLFLVSIGTHPILDAFTTWGTQLFWPFDHTRVAWNTIFVADPLYTLPFVGFVVAAMFFKRTRPKRAKLNRIGLIVSCLYLAITIFNKYRVDNVVEQSLEQQGINYSDYMTNPTPLNNILWYVVVNGDSNQYLGFYSFFDKEAKIDFVALPEGPELPKNLRDTKGVATINRVTKGFETHEVKRNIFLVHDLRFGILNASDYERNSTVKPVYFFTYAIDNSDPENPKFDVVKPPRDAEQLDKMMEVLGETFTRMWGK